MNDSASSDPGQLFAQGAWVHRLAASLVGDASTADDLAQDAWLAALERPPRDGSNPRGWLATVIANLRRQSQRAGARRRAREEAVARKEAQPGNALDVLARAAMHKELVLAVLALREPFRTVVLLRFFDELPPRDIAAQLDVPVRTVNSRLQRGLAELRAQLADAHGDGRAWMSALMPLALAGAAQESAASSLLSSPAALGALAMNAKWKLAAVLVVVVSCALGLRAALDEEPLAQASDAGAELVAGDARASKAPGGETLSVVAGEAARAAASAEPIPAEASAPSASAAPATRVLRGRVLDADAQPIHGLRIAFRPSAGAQDAAPRTAVSDRDGAFEMPAPDAAGDLTPDDPAYTAVLAGAFDPHASIEPVVVAARVRPLAGHVFDEVGAPLTGARVELVLDASFATRFAQVLDASTERDWQAESDERGAFDLGLVPSIDGSRLRTTLAGYQGDVREAPRTADRALEIGLAPIELDRAALVGDVRLPDGMPAEGARVSFGRRVVETDASGRFAFDLAGGDADRVTAVLRGYLPAELEAPPASSPATRWSQFVRLRLDGAPLALAGRVVDARGEGASGMRVWLADPSSFGLVDGVPTQVENLLSGARPSREQQAHYASGAQDDGRDLLWSWFETDAHGRFRIEGLVPRDYRVFAMDPTSLVRIEAGPFTAGSSDVEIRVPASASYEKVSGRVLAKNGEPIGGVVVEAVRRVVKIDDGSGGSVSRGHGGARTTTDAEGRFELGPLARDGIFLVFQSDRIVHTWHDLPEQAESGARELTGLEIRAVRRCHVQVERAEGADEFSVLDASGAKLPLSVIRGENDSTGPVVQLVNGRSLVVALSEDGATVVFYAQKQEIARQPVALVPGERTVVTLPR